jgi:hypothetical protein
VTSGEPGIEINSAFRRYQFDIETEIMLAAKERAKAKGQTFRVYLRELIRADIEESNRGKTQKGRR